MSTQKNRPLPKIVSEAEWRKAHDQILRQEKAATRAEDALAAERRRLPMVRVETDYIFDSERGPVRLIDVFEGRRQLILYHFMFAPGVEGYPNAGCSGCSMFTDNIGQFALIHLAQRDVSFSLVSLAPLENLLAYKQRMGWTAPWISSSKNSFNADFGLSSPDHGEIHGLSVFLQDSGNVYRTYFTGSRGVEALGTSWTFLDLTPYGRQEQWEDSPAGWPQTAPYQWWRRHDEY